MTYTERKFFTRVLIFGVAILLTIGTLKFITIFSSVSILFSIFYLYNLYNCYRVIKLSFEDIRRSYPRFKECRQLKKKLSDVRVFLAKGEFNTDEINKIAPFSYDEETMQGSLIVEDGFLSFEAEFYKQQILGYRVIIWYNNIMGSYNVVTPKYEIVDVNGIKDVAWYLLDAYSNHLAKKIRLETFERTWLNA